MVKKRQADLDVGSLPMKTRTAVSLVAASDKKSGSGGASLLSLIKRTKKERRLKKTKPNSSAHIPDDCLASLPPKSNTGISRSVSVPDTKMLFPPASNYPSDPLARGYSSYPLPIDKPDCKTELNVSDSKHATKANALPTATSVSCKSNNTSKKKNKKKSATLLSKSQTQPTSNTKASKKSKQKAKKKAKLPTSDNSKAGHSKNKTVNEPNAKSSAKKTAPTDFSTRKKKKLPRYNTRSPKKAKQQSKLNARSEIGKHGAADGSGNDALALMAPHFTSFLDNSKTNGGVSDTISTATKRALSSLDRDSQVSSTASNRGKQKFSSNDIPSYVSFDDISSSSNLLSPPRSSIQAALKDLANQTPAMNSHISTLYDEDVPSHGANSRSQALWSVASNSWLVAFSNRLELRGFVTVTSLTKLGIVEVHGHTLDYNESANVYAPPGYHNGVVEYQQPSNQEPGIPPIAELRETLSSLNLDIFTEVSRFCWQHPECALVLFSEFENACLQSCVDMLPVPKVIPGYISLRPRLLVSDCDVAPRYSSTVCKAIQHIVSHQQSGYPLRVVVCGDRNMGKSTLIKYIINKLLPSSKEGVTHLECDPSQCEFSPPGCLTLHTTKQALLGPPWTHIAEGVDNCQLYGAISADIDPEKYVSCMRRLVHAYGAMDTPTPLVVNTMGWKQGLGLHFLAATIAEVRPTHVIQLGTDNNSYKNFEAFTVFRLASHDLYIPTQLQSKLHTVLQYELMPLVMSHHNKLEYESDVLSPVLTRDLATTAYMFMSSLPQQRVINDLLPCRIDMCDVALHLGSDSLPNHLMCDAVRMQIVLLCQASEQMVSSDADSNFLTLSASAELAVIGYGVVRAVDVTNRCVYVSTPLPIGQLSKANVLYKIHGTITPELWYYQQLCKVKDDKGLPYLGCRKTGAGIVSTADARYRFRKGRKD